MRDCFVFAYRFIEFCFCLIDVQSREEKRCLNISHGLDDWSMISVNILTLYVMVTIVTVIVIDFI